MPITIVILAILGCVTSGYAQANSVPWVFAVSGDSRNCGDMVMPAIAAGVHADKARFYWHLGDFRVMTGADQDILAQKTADGRPRKPAVTEYVNIAWPDFIEHQ